VGELRSAVDALAGLDPDELDGGVLGELIAEMMRERDRLDALCHRFVAVHDRRQVWRAEGARSEKQWLGQHCRLSAGEAAGRAVMARRLGALPQTLEAAAQGMVSAGQARVAAQAVRDLPAAALDGLDELVAGSGPGTHAGQLRATVDEYAHQVAPDSLAEREQRAYERRRLAVRRGGDGASLDGFLDVLGAETVLSALAPLAAPRSAVDDRTFEQRMADALVELARRSLDGGDLPDVGGAKPHVTVVVRLETLLGEDGAGPATLDRLGALSGEAARRMCCDAGISRVVIAGGSQVLDAGRETRVVSPAQRRALAVRDGGCIGCLAPVAWCEAHHVVHWVDHGRTDLDNLVLLCGACHREVHHGRGHPVRQPGGHWALVRRE